MATGGPDAERARAEIRAIIGRTGHAVDNAAEAAARLERAFAEGALHPTPELRQALDDLGLALDREAGRKLGGKSPEAARFILRAIDRGLDGA